MALSRAGELARAKACGDFNVATRRKAAGIASGLVTSGAIARTKVGTQFDSTLAKYENVCSR